MRSEAVKRGLNHNATYRFGFGGSDYAESKAGRQSGTFVVRLRIGVLVELR